MKKNYLDTINSEIGKTYNYIKIISYCELNKKFNCECICGKKILRRRAEFRFIKSCGCKRGNDLTNKRNDKLLYLEKVNNKWKCICDCGNIVYHDAKDFTKSRSCGCMVREASKINIQKAINKQIEKTDKLAHIRKQYKKIYNDGDVTFDDFLELSQKNCYYCGSPPSNYKKCQATRKEFLIDFYYNGLDRIDNTIGHYLTNVVTCCKICNFGKSSMAYNKFINLVKKINIKDKEEYKIIEPDKLDLKLKSYYKANYIDGLSFEEFISLSKLDCHYCGAKSCDSESRMKCNGIDRIDSNSNHVLSNCVPCCKHCNRFKSNLNIQDFYNHVNKIKIHLGLSESN